MALVSAENIIRAHCKTEWAPEGAVPVDARTPAEITGNAFVQWRDQQDMPLTPNEERAYDVLTQEEESNGAESEEGSADTGSSAAAEPGAQPAGNTAEEAGQTERDQKDVEFLASLNPQLRRQIMAEEALLEKEAAARQMTLTKMQLAKVQNPQATVM